MKTPKLPAPQIMGPVRENYTIRLTEQEKSTLKKLGGGRWIRACIELARKGETK